MFRIDSDHLNVLAQNSNKELAEMVADIDKVRICSDFKTFNKGTTEAIFGADGDGIHFR